MLIYNLTFNIQSEIQEEWLLWMQEEYMPAMLATKKFTTARLSKVLIREKEGVTYAVQFHCPDKPSFKQYYLEDHSRMAQQLERFKGKMVFFGTEMDVITQQG